jgi:ribosomal protein L10
MEQKQAIIAEVEVVAKTALSALAAEYRGLTVEKLTVLRKNARNAGVYLRVVKNTLARRALANTGFACMGDQLIGPLVRMKARPRQQRYSAILPRTTISLSLKSWLCPVSYSHLRI